MATFNMIHNFIDCILVEILGLLFLSQKQLQVDWKSKHFRHKIYSDHEGEDAAFSLTTWEGRTMIHINFSNYLEWLWLCLRCHNKSRHDNHDWCHWWYIFINITTLYSWHEKIPKSWLKLQNKISHSRNLRRLSSCTRTRTKAALSG